MAGAGAAAFVDGAAGRTTLFFAGTAADANCKGAAGMDVVASDALCQ